MRLGKSRSRECQSRRQERELRGGRYRTRAGPGGAYPEAIQRTGGPSRAGEPYASPCGCEPRKSRTARAVACACASRMPAYLLTDIRGRDARRSCEAPRGRKISLDASALIELG